jgi:flagellar protein FliT
MANGNITRYKAVSNLSSRMLEAARANDWDNLCALEREAATLMQEIRTDDEIAQQAILDNESLRNEKIALIRKILADDREIRSHADPWMESIRTMLSCGSKKRAINNMYGI